MNTPANEGDRMSPADLIGIHSWSNLMRSGTGGDDGGGQVGGNGSGGKGPPPPPPPPFQAATYIFSLDSMWIANLRSRGSDTDFVSAVLQVGDNPPQQIDKNLGDLGTGQQSIGITFAPIMVTDPTTPVVFNYHIVNAGGGNAEQIKNQVQQLGNTAVQAGIKALTTAIAGGVGELVGAQLGTVILPVIGSALGALAGYLVSTGVSALFADCDGPVAFEQAALNGQSIWLQTFYRDPVPMLTQHPGVDSAPGCGSNSYYEIYWSYKRT